MFWYKSLAVSLIRSLPCSPPPPPRPPQDYGETPQYLHQRREEVQRAQQEYDQYVSDRMKEGAMKMLSGEERISIMTVRGGLPGPRHASPHRFKG